MAFLKVSVSLEHGMAEPKQLFHLDALLCAMRVKQAQAIHGEQINPRDFHYEIPVDRYETPSGEWVFMASAFRLERTMPKSWWFQVRRLNITDIAEKRATGFIPLRATKATVEHSPIKQNFNSSYVAYGNLVAYCVGDQAGVENLLRGCTKIGGLRGVGFGNVAQIRVEEVEETQCDWAWRALPADADKALVSSEHARCVGALRSPYWDRTLHTLTVAPAH